MEEIKDKIATKANEITALMEKNIDLLIGDELMKDIRKKIPEMEKIFLMGVWYGAYKAIQADEKDEI
jgi:hypothetical protein